jgi:iron complex outermembrane receptor protein
MHFDTVCRERNPRIAYFVAFALATAVCATQGNVAFAQSAAAEQEQGGVQEIVVTAQRRSEDIQKVPISMTAFTPQALERLDIQSTDQLQFATPGLVNTQTAGDGISAVYIRGVGTGYSGPGLEGSVAFYEDDVYLQTQTSSAQEAIDVAQIQILKGPQGTLYGRNATGGAVVITTNDPKLNTTEGYAQVGYGNLNWTREEGVVNTPIGSTIANRLAEYYQYRDGYANNIVFPQQQKSGVGAGDTWGVRDKLLWEPSEDFKAVLSGEYDRRAGNGAIHSLRYFGDGTPTGLGWYQTEQSLNREGGGGDDTDSLQSILRAEYSLSAKLKLTNTLAYRRARAFGCTDNDGLPAEELYFCTVSQRSPDPGTAQGKVDSTYTDEFRVVSDMGGPFDFTAGAFIERNQARFVGRIGGSFFGATTPTFDNHDELRAYSGYLDAYYKLTDQLKLTTGIRYTNEAKYHTFANDADTLALLAGTGVPSGEQSARFKSFSPRAVLSYDAGAFNYYASFNRGFKSGGFNSPGMGFDPILKPETISAGELGTKYRSADGNLQASTAVFYYDWKNQQVAFITGGGTGISQQNAARSHIWGTELNLDYALTQAWLFDAGVAYTHARYTSFTNAAVYDIIGGGLNATAQNLTGDRLPEAPDVTGDINVTYHYAFPANWAGNFTAGARYTSEYDFNPAGGGQLDAGKQHAFTLVNLTATIVTPIPNLEVRAFCSNLTDHRYISLVSTGNTGVYMTPAEPRLYGASVRYSF